MTTSNSPLTSNVAKARGLGAAKDGVSHWWWQRVTAVLLVPLTIWFIFNFLHILLGASRTAVAEWFASAFNAIGFAALLLVAIYHSKLGLQVVIEDYVHGHAGKIFLLFTLNILAFLMAIITALAVIKLHITGI